MQKPINPKSVRASEPFIIARRLATKELDLWRAVESQRDIHRAMHARSVLAKHDLANGHIESEDDVRIFRTSDVEWE